MGASVTTVKVGDVAIDPNIYCQTCYYRSGRKQHCENLTAIGVRNGGFQVQCCSGKAGLSPRDRWIRNRSNDRALACCLHGIDLAQIRPGDTVCVIGGAIGQLMVQLAKLSRSLHHRTCCGGRLLWKTGDSSTRLRKMWGRQCGAQTRGADVVIECAGNLKATQQALMPPVGAAIVHSACQSPMPSSAEAV